MSLTRLFTYSAILIGITLPAFGQMMGPGIGIGTGRMAGTATSSVMSGYMGSLAVGPDGTAYLVRAASSNSIGMMGAASGGAVLIAVNPQTGKANWKAPISGTMISQPVLGAAGATIYLTTSEPPFLGSTATAQPALLIVTASSGVVNRISIAADMLSAPTVSADGQTVYVLATDVGGFTTAGMTGTGTLYAFSPTGTLKFKVQLSQL